MVEESGPPSVNEVKPLKLRELAKEIRSEEPSTRTAVTVAGGTRRIPWTVLNITGNATT